LNNSFLSFLWSATSDSIWTNRRSIHDRCVITNHTSKFKLISNCGLTCWIKDSALNLFSTYSCNLCSWGITSFIKYLLDLIQLKLMTLIISSFEFILFCWRIILLLKYRLICRLSLFLMRLLLMSHMRLLFWLWLSLCLVLLCIRSILCFIISKFLQIQLHINPRLDNLAWRWNSSLLRNSSLHHYRSICISSCCKIWKQI